jgi:hypothetical protein
VAAVANQELGAELAFKVADLLRQRRSGKMKPRCGSAEMEFLGNSDEVGELP